MIQSNASVRTYSSYHSKRHGPPELFYGLPQRNALKLSYGYAEDTTYVLQLTTSGLRLTTYDLRVLPKTLSTVFPEIIRIEDIL